MVYLLVGTPQREHPPLLIIISVSGGSSGIVYGLQDSVTTNKGLVL